MKQVRSPGRYRVALLAILAGVGFIAGTMCTPAPADEGVGLAASLTAPPRNADTALHPAPGSPGLAALVEDRTVRSGPRSGAAGRGSDAGLGTPSASSRTAGSTSDSASSLFARRALARSGRLSAPATAPPDLPF